MCIFPQILEREIKNKLIKLLFTKSVSLQQHNYSCFAINMSVGTSCVAQGVLPSISNNLVFPVKRFWIRPQSGTLPSTQDRDSGYSREPTDVSGTYEYSQLRLLKSRGTTFTSCNKKCTGFHNLPHNVLVGIFSHFLEGEIGTVLAHVCRHWWLASHHPSLWRHLEFHGGCVPISVICRVLRRAPQLESVKFIAVPDVSTAIRQLCRCNVDVRSVSVKYCTGKEEHIPESVLRNLVVSCHKLCCLDLKGTQFYAQRFYQDLVNLAHLKSLNLGLNRFLKAQDLMLVAINCRGLEELRLSRRRTNSEQHTLTDPDASFLFHNMRCSLRSLKFDAQGLGAETFQAILSCSLLENLCLTNALFLTGDLFQSIPKKLPNLTKLKITKACQLSTYDFSHMFMFEREKMKKLTSLNISGCWRLDDFGLKAIVDTTFKSLEQLSLHSCKSLTSDGIDYVIKGCTKLRHLNIAHIVRLDASCLKEISSRTVHLKTLIVSNIDNEVLRNIKSNISELRIIISHSEYFKKMCDFV